jgi:hypothetical protein
MPHSIPVPRLAAAVLTVVLGLTGPVILAQTHYATPEAAIQALIDAAASEEPGALQPVLGPEAAELGSGDPVADATAREAFVEAASEIARIEQEEGAEDRALLTIGEDEWPFPIPLVKDAEGWRFDTAAGKDELINRRIGRNELYTIAVARAFVDAQHEYAAADRDGDGTREFAQRLMSREGQRDGLYWPASAGEADSPMGPLIAAAVGEGYRPGGVDADAPKPYHGYLYRILTAQGARPPGGARSYLSGEDLTGGFALLAWPVAYGQSGIMSFQVNASGMLFQKDLGDETAAAVAAMMAYDPGKGWEAVTD